MKVLFVYPELRQDKGLEEYLKENGYKVGQEGVYVSAYLKDGDHSKYNVVFYFIEVSTPFSYYEDIRGCHILRYDKNNIEKTLYKAVLAAFQHAEEVKNENN